jgi:UDP-N-acetylmuramate: L-alanyl-gamma-D-glutamyl-meso-diaminopimelate ligase
MGDVPLSVFGAHNLLNLEGARHICQQLGIMDEDFYEAIMSFKGASNVWKRWKEKIKEHCIKILPTLRVR